MAKNKAQAAEPQTADAPVAETKKKAPPPPTGPKKEWVKLLRDLNEGEKVAPQALGIMNAVRTFNGNVCTREQLLAILPDHIDTKQSAGRIFQFYRKKLEEAGILGYEDIKEPAPAKGESKAA